jgi:hypothetical protein
MKKHFLSHLKRFFSILILDKDILVAERPVVIEEKTQNTLHPLFTTPPKTEHTSISIQPEEIGEKEHINTRVYDDTFSGDNESVAPLLTEEAYSIPLSTQEPQESYNKQSAEEEFYDYAMSDIPNSIIEPEKTLPHDEEPVRKSEKFVSLRDVLVERGNFWQDKNKKVENIWERDQEIPEEEIHIKDGMLV